VSMHDRLASLRKPGTTVDSNECVRLSFATSSTGFSFFTGRKPNARSCHFPRWRSQDLDGARS
jgi:hypothetical protein